MTTTWVLVPCSRSRRGELYELLSGLRHPTDRVVVVTTTEDGLQPIDVGDWADHLVTVPWDGMRISEWWNAGLDFIASTRRHDDRWEVLVIGSDAKGTPAGVTALREALRAHTLSMVGPDFHGRLSPGDMEVFGPRDHRDVIRRLPGSCFMVAGEEGLRCDPLLRWWYSDDDLEMQARHLNGAGLVGGVDLLHTTDHPLDEEQTRWATEDRERFVTKWGRQPW